MAGVKAGRVRLCQVAGNTVWSHMPSDITKLWDGVPLAAIEGDYKFNQANFQEIPGGILRKIQDMFALLRPPSEGTPRAEIPTVWAFQLSVSPPQPNRNLGERHKLPHRGPGQSPGRKRVFGASGTWKNTSDGDKFRIFSTNIYPYFYDWKPIRSIFNILHKISRRTN